MRRELDTVDIKCQIFVEQHEGGTVWVPSNTLIGYRLSTGVGMESQDENLHADEEFATLGWAVEAAQQNALRVIQQKHPNVRKEDVQWSVISEEIRGWRHHLGPCIYPQRVKAAERKSERGKQKVSCQMAFSGSEAHMG